MRCGLARVTFVRGGLAAPTELRALQRLVGHDACAVGHLSIFFFRFQSAGYRWKALDELFNAVGTVLAIMTDFPRLADTPDTDRDPITARRIE